MGKGKGRWVGGALGEGGPGAHATASRSCLPNCRTTSMENGLRGVRGGRRWVRRSRGETSSHVEWLCRLISCTAAAQGLHRQGSRQCSSRAAYAASTPVRVLAQEVVEAQPQPLENHAHMISVLERLEHPHAVPATVHETHVDECPRSVRCEWRVLARTFCHQDRSPAKP